MSLVDLAAVKLAVKAADFNDDDAHLQSLIDAAEEAVAGHLRRNISTEFVGGLPSDIQQAVKLLVAAWYASDDGPGSDWPKGVTRLLAPHRSFG